jgi:hypothetical protein
MRSSFTKLPALDAETVLLEAARKMYDSSGGIRMKARSDLLVEVVDEDLLVLDRAAGKIHKLNSSASVVWRAIEKGSSTTSIAWELSEIYGIELDVATKDTQDILSKFASLSMIEENQ